MTPSIGMLLTAVVGSAGDPSTTTTTIPDPVASPIGAVLPTLPVDVDSLVGACGERPSWFCEAVWNATESATAARAVDWFVTRPLVALVIALVAAILSRYLRKATTALVTRIVLHDQVAASAFDKTFDKIGVTSPIAVHEPDPRQTKRADTLAAVLRAGVSAVVWSVATLMILGVFNINLVPLLASAGIAGIAIGFGAQSLVRDCIAGFFILLEDQFGVGDVVDVGEAIGTVESVTLRATTLRAVDGTQWTVPNGAIIRVGNRSRSWVQALLDVTIRQDADVERALAELQAAVDDVFARPEVAEHLIEGPTVTGVELIGPTGITLRATAQVTPGEQWAILRALRIEVKHRFDAAGIVMPQPLQLGTEQA
jgi:small conductance mechanosensitive channel